MLLLTTFPGCGLGHSWVSVIMFEENCSQQQSCSTHRCVFQCMSPQSGKFITAKATFIEKQWGFGPSFGLRSWMISFWGLSGASAGSTLNSVAKTHSSICLLFTSLTMSLNTLIIFTHSPAHSSVREGLSLLSRCTFHSLTLPRDDFMCESKELRSRLGPCSFRFSPQSTWNVHCECQTTQPLAATEFPNGFLHPHEVLDFIPQFLKTHEHVSTTQPPHFGDKHNPGTQIRDRVATPYTGGY